MQKLYLIFLMLLPHLSFASEHIDHVSDHPVSILSNQIRVAPSVVQADSSDHVGQIQFQLESKSNVQLKVNEHVPALHALVVESGKVLVAQHAGHWRTEPLPQSCQVQVPLGYILVVRGQLSAQGQLTDLRCRLGAHASKAQRQLMSKHVLPTMGEAQKASTSVAAVLPRWQVRTVTRSSERRHARSI